MFCYRHPKVETVVLCGKCEQPICTRCMVSGPAGMRCPSCASLRASHLYRVNPVHLGILTAIGLASGYIGSEIIGVIGLMFFFIFFLASAYGGAVGELMQRAIGRKQGRIVEAVGVASMVVGGIMPMIYDMVKFSLPPAALVADWPQLLGIGIAAAACYGRLQF